MAADTYTAGATSAVHSLRAYIIHNPFKSVEAMTLQDFDAMFDLFIAENAEISATPSFVVVDEVTTLSFPGDIDAADSQASADQAIYPEKHRSGG